jgi:polysaccharide biosynthesis/export protein
MRIPHTLGQIMRFIAPLCLSISVALLSGCATHGRRALTKMPLSLQNLSEDSAFSDEVSRDLVRQTRHLIQLRETDYLVGPDDVLEISIFEWELSAETKTLEFRVSESGVIPLPALGAVSVGGKSIEQIQAEIERQLSAKGVLQNPRVGVSVKEYRSRRIAVIGEVNAPGVYAIHENVTTLMDMLTLAGGPAPSAGQIAYVLRKEKAQFAPARIVVNLERLFDEGNFELNAVLQGDDVIFVPNAPLVYVYGSVAAPGGYAMKRSLRALEAIALAGGFTRDADKRAGFLVRRKGNAQSEQVIPLDVYDIERGKTPDVYLREGDIVHIPDSPTRIAGRHLWDFFRGIFTFTYRLDSE